MDWIGSGDEEGHGIRRQQLTVANPVASATRDGEEDVMGK